MFIIGERINASRKSIAKAIETQDADFIKKEAEDQLKAGADLIDVNAGVFIEKEADYLSWLVKTIQVEREVLLCIDSANPKALAGALSVHKGRAMINSITDEKDRYEKMIPVIREFRPQVVALCITDGGMPANSKERFLIASKLIEKLTSDGVSPGDIFIDPLVMPLSTDKNYGMAVLETIEQIATRFPNVNTICGLSNISFGLPSRRYINQIFLVMAMTRQLKAVILDPLDKRIMANLIITRSLLGRDEYCEEFLTAFRTGKLDVE